MILADHAGATKGQRKEVHKNHPRPILADKLCLLRWWVVFVFVYFFNYLSLPKLFYGFSANPTPRETHKAHNYHIIYRRVIIA